MSFIIISPFITPLVMLSAFAILLIYELILFLQYQKEVGKSPPFSITSDLSGLISS